ncbi:MAG: PKD domain-containing protein [Gammaproteobacteria bacterium]|nr:MAG: PKD domain-containing protein [Gammaproteobacteria bacterium]
MLHAIDSARPEQILIRRGGLMRSALLLCLVAVLNTACGGGGSSATAAPVAPTASFTAQPGEGQAPLTVSFNAGASVPGEGALTSYTWQFGDGSTASGIQVQNIYQEAGSFQPRLTVTNSAGRSASTTQTVTATPPPATYTVSGTLLIGSTSASDTTTNDPNAGFTHNDTLSDPQAVTAPVVIGGYVAQRGAGPEGAVQANGDQSDFYRFQAEGGEQIELVIGNPDLDAQGNARNDLNLALFFEDALVEQTFDSGSTASLRVPDQSGTYVLEVRVESGASTYVVAIGGSSGMMSELRASTRFIPGEMLLGPERLQASAGTTSPLPYQVVPERSHAGMRLAQLPRGLPGSMARTLQGHAAERSLREAVARSPLPDVELRLATLEAIQSLRRSGRYAWVEPNYVREAQQLVVPDDPLFLNQWHYENIQLPLAWDRSTGSPDVHVSVIDTGVLLDHPDLQGQLLPGYDFRNNVPGAADPGDGGGGGASSFHGSHVTGTVAARTDNATGVAGAGWQTRVLPIRVLGRSGGSSDDLMEALRYAAGLENRSQTVPERPVDIINLSLGGEGSSAQEQALFDEIRSLGIFVVAAAGNQSSSTPFFPASYQGVLAVSATAIDNQPASYSNFGPQIDLAAPGGEPVFGGAVLSTVGREVEDSEGNRSVEFIYQGRAGTSMAAPHVAGVIALMKAVFPDLTPEIFDSLLMSGALTDDLGEPGRDDRYGFGLINARKAVVAAQQFADGSLEIPAQIVASPRSLDFGPFGTRATLTLSNAGTVPAAVTGITVNALWLSVAEDNVADDGLGSYQVAVQRDGLADGSYRAEIEVTTTDNDVIVPVQLRVVTGGMDADAGFHYIVLADPDTGEVMEQVTAVAVDGRYDFVFENVPEGEYELYAGTDMNNNFLVCDEVEACALFPTLDSPGILQVNQDITDIEFVTGFRTIRFDAGTEAPGAAAAASRPGPRSRSRLEITP